MADEGVKRGRLVAFLDVLGFSAKLGSNPLEELYQNFAEVVDEIKDKTILSSPGGTGNRSNFAFAQFMSDSLVLVSHPVEDIYNVNNFIAAISEIIALGLDAGFPFRGAISVSDVVFDDGRNIFLAENFPAIVKFEGEQEWVGCVVLDDAKDLVLEAAFGSTTEDRMKITDFVHISKVPLKGDRHPIMVCINFMFPRFLAGPGSRLNELIEPKRSNTEKHIHDVLVAGFEAQNLGEEFLPAKYMAVMKTRTGFRCQFLDEQVRECDPGLDEWSWTAEGNAS
ncbi:hypothetical protein [Tateyamaria sp.]|uniref:hypothetical protein n=1 Tax=Tateyamaria sp. TaxID=1929288 RepID=UPI00329EB07C